MAPAFRTSLALIVFLSACASDGCVIGQTENNYRSPSGVLITTTAPKRGPCDEVGLTDSNRAIFAARKERQAELDRSANPYCIQPDEIPEPWQIWSGGGKPSASDASVWLLAEIADLGLSAGEPNAAGEEMLAQNAMLVSVRLRQPGKERRIMSGGWLQSFIDGLDIEGDSRIEAVDAPAAGDGPYAMRPFVSRAGQPLYLANSGDVFCHDQGAETPDNPRVVCAYILEGGNVYGTITLPSASVPDLPEAAAIAAELAARLTIPCGEGQTSALSPAQLGLTVRAS